MKSVKDQTKLDIEKASQLEHEAAFVKKYSHAISAWQQRYPLTQLPITRDHDGSYVWVNHKELRRKQ